MLKLSAEEEAVDSILLLAAILVHSSKRDLAAKEAKGEDVQVVFSKEGVDAKRVVVSFAGKMDS